MELPESDITGADIGDHPEADIEHILHHYEIHKRFNSYLRGVMGAGTAAFGRLADPDTPQHLRVVSLGDSVGDVKMRHMFTPLDRAWGGGGGFAGASVGAAQFGTGWEIGGITTTSTTGTVTDATADWSAWPIGKVQRFATGATRAYGQGGVDAYWDTAKIYYVMGPSSPDGGTFQPQVEGVDEGAPVSTVSGTVALGVVTITKGSVAQRELKIVNLTGAHRIVGVEFQNSAIGGLVHAGLTQGGIALSDAMSTSTGRANLATYLEEFDPHLVTVEAKDTSSTFATSLALLLPLIKAACPAATIIGIASTPQSSGDADQVIQNAQMRVACAAAGVHFWDGYRPLTNWATVDAFGWGGDGIHLAEEVNAFLAALLMDDFHLLTHPGLSGHRDVNASVARVRERVDLGLAIQDGDPLANAAFVPDTVFKLDIMLLLRRVMDVLGPTETFDGNSWRFRPAGGADQQIPHGVRVGEVGPYLQADGTWLYVMDSRGGGNAADLWANKIHCGGTWEEPFLMGNWRLWINASTNEFYKKNGGNPSSDTDGTIGWA